MGASIAGTSTASSEMATSGEGVEGIQCSSAASVSLGQSGDGRPVPVAEQSSGGPSGRWRVGSEPQRASRDAIQQAARDRVA